jgi:hypothetical protein
VPVSVTLVVLPVALSEIVIELEWLPLVVGLNATLIVQLEPAAREVPQLLLCVN